MKNFTKDELSYLGCHVEICEGKCGCLTECLILVADRYTEWTLCNLGEPNG